MLLDLDTYISINRYIAKKDGKKNRYSNKSVSIKLHPENSLPVKTYNKEEKIYRLADVYYSPFMCFAPPVTREETGGYSGRVYAPPMLSQENVCVARAAIDQRVDKGLVLLTRFGRRSHINQKTLYKDNGRENIGMGDYMLKRDLIRWRYKT